jgi:hypothetical protein
LAYSKDEYYKILGIPNDFRNATKELAVIERVVYNYSVAVHPKYNNRKEAEKA